tara:strand:- start:975 stop:1148 length:174 start_codon:yes stop_codon:yes gene_type:complete
VAGPSLKKEYGEAGSAREKKQKSSPGASRKKTVNELFAWDPSKMGRELPLWLMPDRS